MAEMISALNLLLRERDSLREALQRLHDWALAQQGDCMFSGDHPLAQAAIALNGVPPRAATASVWATCPKCKNHERCEEQGCVDRAASAPAPMLKECPKCGTEEWDRVTNRVAPGEVFNRCARCNHEWEVW